MSQDFQKFILKNKYYEHNERINTLPFRSFYIPFHKKDEIKYNFRIVDRFSSSRYISLDGKWSYKAYKSLFDIKSIDDELLEEIDVPSVVQMYGYDYNQYSNLLYPFPYNPPYVPKENPAFHYQRHIFLNKKEHYYLCFDGVDSSFYLFINKKFVGYSLITHSLSEFDVTRFLKNGDNIIDVIVLKWNASSYLEDQDKFRFSGIIRHCYLLRRPLKHIEDYKFETRVENKKGYLDFYNYSQIDLAIKFKNKKYIVKKNEKTSIEINKPKIWCAERPILYDLLIIGNQEKILERVGFRSVLVENGIFKINGKHQKLKGVNRHEFHPTKGSAISLEDTYKDLVMIKEYGANAIRTSHYPDMPEFYQLTDVLGLYIIDEADLETHGVAASQGGYDLKLWQEFTNNEFYFDAVKNRHISLYERDKNRTSVIMWSLGNESSWGRMFYEGCDYIHAHDKRPVHYEGIYNTPHEGEYYTDRLDVVSYMYPSVEYMANNYLKDPLEKRPLVLCEYSHAMGNSNGDLSDYWKLINSNDRFIGAFIWEWKDHGILVNDKYLYGGDFNEKQHDGNFCIDGLVGPSLEVKTNLLEMEACYKGRYLPSKCINKCRKLESLNSDNPIKIDIDQNNGSIVQIFDHDKPILTKPMSLNFFRAFIDNDRYDIDKLKGYMNSPIKVTKLTKEDNHISLKIKQGEFIKVSLDYYLYNDALDIKLSYQISDNVNILPRVGLEFAIDKKNQDFSYFGFGEDESYIDKRLHTRCGEYQGNVNTNYQRYIKPQESGSHYYSSYLDIANMHITAARPFSFNVIPYARDELISSPHDFELPTSNATYISLDVFMSGIGTHSCGPELLDKYRIPKKGNNTFRIIFKD